MVQEKHYIYSCFVERKKVISSDEDQSSDESTISGASSTGKKIGKGPVIITAG
jgi:hypothetical protein